MIFLRFILIFLFMAFVPTQGFADSKSDAIDAISKANVAYEKGDFYAAIRHYHIAFDLTGDSRVLYRIGITYENLANFQRAREFLERYLKKTKDKKYIGRVRKKVATLKRLEKTVQSIVLITTKPPNADVFLKNESETSMGKTPIKLPLAPGEHEILILKDGFEKQTISVFSKNSDLLRKEIKLRKIKQVFTEKKKKKVVKKIEAPVEKNKIDTSIHADKISAVRLGPSSGVNALLLTAIGGSVLMVLLGTLGIAQPSSGIPGAPLIVSGGGGFALSGYFLWVFQWNPPHIERDEPRQTHIALPPSKSFGVGIKF